MPKLVPVSWKILEKILLADGFIHVRTKGGHRIYQKEGLFRPLVVPCHSTLSVDVIKSNMRTAGMTRKRYFELLKQVS